MTNNRMERTEQVRMLTYRHEPDIPAVVRRRAKRTAAYCRVSTLQEEQDLSFETQRDYYLKLIEGSPYMIPAGIYADQGFSGLQSHGRREFQRMIEDCEKGKIDQILVKSLSRFSRNAAECVTYLQRLKTLGVAVQFEKEGLSSFDHEAELLLSIYASIAQHESCVLSQNVSWTKRYSAAMGRPCQGACYGYRIERGPGNKSGTWKIDEEEAKRIRLMFDLAVSAHTYGEIIQALNEYEIAHGGKPFWTYWRVSAALKREAYRGDLLTNKTVVLDYTRKKAVKNTGFVDQYYLEKHHEAIVAQAIYDKVQKYLKIHLLSARHRKLRAKWFQKQAVKRGKKRKGKVNAIREGE
ncbi:MAG: recombinase family protein [Clostridia bacterium]|nr:recombinase family protein [Clostridia bacterium]